MALLLGVASMVVSPSSHAKCVQGGKTAYRMQGSKWIPAKVCIQNARIDVYPRNGELPVAGFSLGESVELTTTKRHRSSEGIRAAVVMSLVIAGAAVGEHWKGCRSGNRDVSDCTASAYGNLAIGSVVAGAGIGGIIALTKSKHPTVTVGEGLKSITFRVRSGDRKWLEDALAGRL